MTGVRAERRHVALEDVDDVQEGSEEWREDDNEFIVGPGWCARRGEW